MGAASGGMANESGHFCICMLNENYRKDEDNKWIFCNGCKNWFHHKCNLLSDNEYNEIINSKRNWFCSEPKCQENKAIFIQQSTSPAPKQMESKIRPRLHRNCKEHNSKDNSGSSGLNNLKNLLQKTKDKYHSMHPKDSGWPCPFCLNKEQTISHAKYTL